MYIADKKHAPIVLSPTHNAPKVLCLNKTGHLQDKSPSDTRSSSSISDAIT